MADNNLPNITEEFAETFVVKLASLCDQASAGSLTEVGFVQGTVDFLKFIDGWIGERHGAPTL